MKTFERTAGILVTFAGLGTVIATLSQKIAPVLRISQTSLLVGLGIGYLILFTVLVRSKRSKDQASVAPKP